MICSPQAVSEKWPALVEAGATVVLAGVAIFQWLAMRKNNTTMAAQAQQERDRWKEEDKIRKEANTPKAAFGLLDCPKCKLNLFCTNLGTVAFLVVGMQVTPLWGDQKKISFGEGNEILVPVGEKKQVELDRDKYRTLNTQLCAILQGSPRTLSSHLGIKLILQGPLETIETNFEAYRLRCPPIDDGSLFYGVDSWRTIHPSSNGYPKSQFVACPKCLTKDIPIDLVADLGVVLPVEDCGAMFEAARNKMVEVMRGIEQSCPAHTIPRVVE